MKAVLREPLVYFAALTALLFASSALSSKPRESRAIVIDKDRIASLVRQFVDTSQRQPTEVEISKLIDDYVREEISVREAIALGLDKDDTVIRRRLRERLELLAQEGHENAKRQKAVDEYYHALLAHYTIVRSTEEPKHE